MLAAFVSLSTGDRSGKTRLNKSSRDIEGVVGLLGLNGMEKLQSSRRYGFARGE
jgi:hypothetical protein